MDIIMTNNFRIDPDNFRMSRRNSRVTFASLSHRFRIGFQAVNSAVSLANKVLNEGTFDTERKNTSPGTKKQSLFMDQSMDIIMTNNFRIDPDNFRMSRRNSRITFASVSYRFRIGFQTVNSAVSLENKVLDEGTFDTERKITSPVT